MKHDYNEEDIRRYRAGHFFDDANADRVGLSLRFDITGRDFDRAGVASTTMKKNFERLGLRPDIIHRASIASYEAEMNLIIYTDGGTMTFDVNSEKISILVEDRGPGIADVGLALQEGYTTAEPWVRELGFGAGMGLPNIRKCSDNLDIQSAVGVGTTVKIEILLSGVNHETERPDRETGP